MNKIFVKTGRSEEARDAIKVFPQARVIEHDF